MRDVLMALMPDWLGFKGTLMRSKGKKRITPLIGVAATMFFTVFIGAGAAKVTTYAMETFAGYPDLLRLIEINVLSAVSLAAFVLLLMTGIRGIYSSYYESGDTAFLLATPLRVEAVFFSKLLKSIMSNFLLLLPFAGSIWIGYGVAHGASAVYYPITAVSLILIAAMFTALSSVLVMVIMRFVPGQRMKQVMIVGSLMMSLVFVFGVQYLNSTLNMGNGSGQTRAFLESAGEWGLDTTSYLPHIWLTKTLLTFSGAHSFGLSGSLVPMVVVGLASVFIAVLLARQTFLTGWSSSQESEGRKRAARPHDRASVSGRPGAARRDRAESFDSPPGVIRGMLRKDLRVFLRTPTMWYSIAVVIIVMGFMTYNLVQGIGDQDLGSVAGQSMGGADQFIPVMLLFMVMLMSASVNARSGALSVSFEGKSWWMIKSMPIEPGVYYLEKLVYGFLSGSLIGLLVVLGMSSVPQVPMFPLYISIPTVIAVGSVITAVSLTLDILYPDFSLGSALDRTTGRQRGGASMGKYMGELLVSMALVVLLGAVFALPVYYGYIRVVAWMSPLAVKILAAGVFIAITIAANSVCYRVGSRKLATMFVGVE